MSAFSFVLFLHITIVISAFVLAGAMHVCEILMRRAQTVAEVRVLARVGKAGPFFAVFVILLIGSGMSLVSLSKHADKFRVADPFAWTALVALAVLFVTGPAIMAPHHRRLTAAINSAAEGPASADLRALALNRTVVTVGFLNTFLALGVVFNMANKPSAGGAIAALVLFAAAGAAIGFAMSAAPSRPTAVEPQAG
jgi:hypothetical protein